MSTVEKGKVHQMHLTIHFNVIVVVKGKAQTRLSSLTNTLTVNKPDDIPMYFFHVCANKI